MCTIDDTVTPIRFHLRGYFSKLLQKNKQHWGCRADKRKTKTHFYGEALTLDEVYERVVQEKEERSRSKLRGKADAKVSRGKRNSVKATSRVAKSKAKVKSASHKVKQSSKKLPKTRVHSTPSPITVKLLQKLMTNLSVMMTNVEDAIKMMTRMVGDPGWDVTLVSAGSTTNALVLMQYQKVFGHVRTVQTRTYTLSLYMYVNVIGLHDGRIWLCECCTSSALALCNVFYVFESCSQRCFCHVNSTSIAPTSLLRVFPF